MLDDAGSPTVPLIAWMTPPLGARRVAFSRFACAVCTVSCAEATEFCALWMSAGFDARVLSALCTDRRVRSIVAGTFCTAVT